MATLTLTVGASADDAIINDSAYDDTGTTMNVGGVGTSPNTNFGQGWRFTGVTLNGSDTVTSAVMKLMKSSTQWLTCDHRWTAILEVNTATFSSGSAPGSRSIATNIAGESLNVNHTDGTVYDLPSTGGLQSTLGAAIDEVISQGSWASGNALAVVNNSDQDASANQTFGRESYHTYDSSTSSSEPQLVITYTPGAATLEQAKYRFRNDDGSETTATWKAAQNTAISEGTGTNVRLRFQIQATNDPTAKAFKLQYRRSGGNWENV